MGGIGALLLGTGVTAFGIAPLAPDAADLPVQQVVEALAVPAPQPAAAIDTGNTLLADPLAWVLYRSDTTRSDDTAQSLLQRLGAADTEAQAFLARDPMARQLVGRSA